MAKVNALLGNVAQYQPKTGAACDCRPGLQRDNCTSCEGTGRKVDFNALRNAAPLVPVFVNLDPRGYALKINDGWIRGASANGNPTAGNLGALVLHRDLGGYGILAPDLMA